jgi:AraC-like DNA-binding protein
MDIISKIQQYQQFGISIRKTNKQTNEVYNEILLYTSFLPQSCKIKERIYCVLNNISIIPLCKHCKIENVSFLGPATGYREYCSVKCSSNSQEKKDQIISTNIVRYGTKTPAESSVIRQKTVDTLTNRYGDGITSTQQVPDIKQKSIQSNIERFGSPCYTSSEIGKAKITKTNLERYNKTRFRQTDEYTIQFTETCNTKYNRDHHKQRHISVDNLVLLNDPDWLLDQHKNNKLTQNSIARVLGVSPRTISKKFQDFNIEPLQFYQSVGEQQLTQFIQDNYDGNIILRTRSIISPLELDIYLPDLKLAIEYSGIYWHSENNGKDKSYHLTKLNRCTELGIRLIQLYDTEWARKQDIVKSRILHALGKSKQVYARKCKIVDLNTKQTKQFLIDNHIQGYCVSTINLGLSCGDELVAIMTIGACRFNKQVQYELLRYASVINKSVVGGANKLLHHFIKTYSPISIISYCDLRWGIGALYLKLGMTQYPNSPPAYNYFNPSKLELLNRQQFQKHKLESKLPIFDHTLTEWENMKINGYYRIWNCGNAKFILTLTEEQ